MDIREFWKDVLAQDRERLPGYFAPGAEIRWHCSGERFTAEEFVRANCDYPGKWKGEIERVDPLPGGLVTAVRVFPTQGAESYHVVSFFALGEAGITSLDEYWSDDGEPPEWRKEMGIGRRL